MRKLLMLAAVVLMQATGHAETIYRATIDINGRKFHDLIAIDNIPTGGGPAYYPIKGTLTVPGVFTVPLSGFYIEEDPYALQPTMTIDITAVEGGKPFKVHYKLYLDTGLRTGTGFATLEDGSRLGTIEALKIF